ncbi:MAG TPA: hypothetical protein VF604_08010 [Pyrinomonadaceae bacterium]|jgi:hypothetical protein
MKSVNLKFGWLVLSLALLSFNAIAREKTFDQSVLSEKGREAYQTLLKVELFALGGVGYGGSSSEGEQALDILVQEKQAIPAFRSLVKISTPEGGLYALVGLKMLNCDCLKEELTNYRSLPEPPARKENTRDKIEKGNVERMRGCFIFQESRLKIAGDIETDKEEIKWKLDNSAKKKQ